MDEGMTDQQLTDLIVGYGDTEPTMYIAEWNRTVTFMALALDASGQAEPSAARRHARQDAACESRNPAGVPFRPHGDTRNPAHERRLDNRIRA
ncbi:MAG: hypothetical protein ACLS37_08255 [Alistipes sp.]